jgi:hypothetical protein
VLGLNGTILQSNNYVNPFVVAAKGQEAMLTTDFAQCVRESIQRAGDAVGILDTEKQQGHPSLDTVRADRAAKQKALDDAREAKKKAAEEDRKNAEAPSKPAAPPVSPMVKRVGWAIVFGAAIFSAGVLLRYITTPEADRSALLASVQGSIVLDSVVIALLMIGEYSKRWAK